MKYSAIISGALVLIVLIAPSFAEQRPDIEGLSVATFAGGCFWCTEADFEKVTGVKQAISGYSGGHVANPSYEQVSAGNTGHVEAVQVHYDPKVISYTGLLYYFWRHIDPTDAGGQFVDRGKQYRPLIFYHDAEQKQMAEQSLAELISSNRYDKPVTIEILPFDTFYEAEAYHQDYYKRNPIRYKFYRYNSGRDQYLEKIWGDELQQPYREKTMSEQRYNKPLDAQIKSMLTPLQYKVTQEEGTEPPFNNEYWDEKRAGIYVDIVTGEPLFSSIDKFNSGTGWPSFTRPIDDDSLVQKTDFRLIYPRTELRSRIGDSHLGHVFNDGPQPTGKRYCINSLSIDHVPTDKKESE